MTKDQLSLLRELWEAGVVSRLIGERLGCSGSHIRMLAIQLRLPPRLSDDRRNSVCQDTDVGMVHEVPEYSSWIEMRRRKDASRHPTYTGGKTSVDPRWEDFTTFYRDMGPKPSRRHTLDRVDNELGYSKSNCRWATPTEQANNRSNNHFITYKGRTLTLAQAAREHGIDKDLLRGRLVRGGWSVEDALTRPIRKQRSKT